jgi:dUTP pyrophosphatase
MNFLQNSDFINDEFISYTKSLTTACNEKFMYLSIYVDDLDNNLKNIYINAADKHNKKIIEDPFFYDAGFDLFLPKSNNNDDNMHFGTKFFAMTQDEHFHSTNKINFKIKCCARMYNIKDERFCYTGFEVNPRSSLSKSPLRLANSTGIIDAGYRGNLIGVFDCIHKEDDMEYDWYELEYSRLLQICAPNMSPIYVKIVDTLEELGPSTSRGEGGIGSTGK